MSLESDRRSAGASAVASRQSGATSLIAERKAIATGISTDRSGSGSQISDDINRLVTPKKKTTSLPALDPRGRVPAAKGVGTFNPKNAPATSGGGIASPLTETAFKAREYWPDGMLSSDGLFSIPAIKKLVLADANGAEAVINLAQPIPA
ncbi:hypothetical protein [Pseudomonas huanghezhanensis]|uniref:hypothetical protein n=1 Tax=Pseudomonas huanghezhanensis TaxID=3002903 RepID=UPI0022860891|nr:hypothetical protein [Pseudomonas sp. BSw22131]